MVVVKLDNADQSASSLRRERCLLGRQDCTTGCKLIVEWSRSAEDNKIDLRRGADYLDAATSFKAAVEMAQVQKVDPDT